MSRLADRDQTTRWLLRDKYGWSETEIVSNKNLPSSLQEDLDRVAAGEPLAYVIGWVEFLGAHINLSHKTLIPRPETEYWVQQLIESNNPGERPIRVLDLCCGSGCIGIALLKHWPTAQLEFVDLADRAIAQTKINVELNQVSPTRFTVRQADLFSGQTGTYDLIVANPPYVDPLGEVSPSLKHEPPEALFATNQGLSLIQQIISNVKTYLNPTGEAWLEIGQGQDTAVQQLCESSGLKVNFVRDQYGVLRVARIQQTQ